MELNYNVTGEERKALVKAISQITGEKAVYKYMPTCAFEIGPFTVSKEGALSFEDSKYDAARDLIDRLREQGFEPETDDTTVEEENSEETETNAETESDAIEEAPEAAEGTTEPEVDDAGELMGETAKASDEAAESPDEGQEKDAGKEEPTALSISVPDDLTDGEFEN